MRRRSSPSTGSRRRGSTRNGSSLTSPALLAREHRDRRRRRRRRLAARAQRRANREPLAYVLGEWGFRRLTLRCDERALVPRPETETVVERCIELLRDVQAPRVLDVGTGTGAIALALADEVPGARVVAIDSSAEALVARARERGAHRARRRAPASRPERRAARQGPFDLVVSNPPYVRAEELDTLEPEVRDWEPREALLDSRSDGGARSCRTRRPRARRRARARDPRAARRGGPRATGKPRLPR